MRRVFGLNTPIMSTPIRLIVGLGNPGPDYETTRHNAGFWLADHLADDLRASFALEKSFFGMVAKARLGADNVLLLKPNTYMNRSGQAVGALARFYKLAPEAVLVLHDELDLMPGQVKLKQGGGHAGHNGLKDIQAALGSPNFWRLRIGIGHPRTLGWRSRSRTSSCTRRAAKSRRRSRPSSTAAAPWCRRCWPAIFRWRRGNFTAATMPNGIVAVRRGR